VSIVLYGVQKSGEAIFDVVTAKLSHPGVATVYLADETGFAEDTKVVTEGGLGDR
jgi:hypothetical protein